VGQGWPAVVIVSHGFELLKRPSERESRRARREFGRGVSTSCADFSARIATSSHRNVPRSRSCVILKAFLAATVALPSVPDRLALRRTNGDRIV